MKKVTTGTQNLALFIWNNALLVEFAGACGIGRSEFGSVSISEVLCISGITQFFDFDKSNSIPHLIKGKSRKLKRLLKYFNWTPASVSNAELLIGVLPIIFVLQSKKLLVVVSLLYLFVYSSVSATVIVPFTTIYGSLWSHKSHLNATVLSLYYC